MNEVTERTIRFRHAAAAIGVTKKTLRNWLSRDLATTIVLTSPNEGERGWKLFSGFDLATLAVTNKLSHYGFPLKIAYDAAKNAVGIPCYALSLYRNTPLAAMLAALTGWQLAGYRSNDSCQFHVISPGEELSSDWPKTSVLIVDLHAVVAEAINRLNAAIIDDDNDEK